MQSIGPQKAIIFQNRDFDMPPAPNPAGDSSKYLWQYRNLKSVSGIPVQKEAQDLPVQNFQQLQQALQLNTDTKVWVGYLSPQQEDKSSLQKYEEIKSLQVQGSVFIQQQERHFCPGLNKFLIMLVYSQCKYTLNPRYKYLKEELI